MVSFFVCRRPFFTLQLVIEQDALRCFKEPTLWYLRRIYLLVLGGLQERAQSARN
jgi:hypothetical protein